MKLWILLIFLVSCSAYSDVETEYWQVTEVESGNVLLLRRGWETRRLQLCGIELSDPKNARVYLQQLASNLELPVIFAGKSKNTWYGDVWVPLPGDEEWGERWGEESVSGILLLKRLAFLSKEAQQFPKYKALSGAVDLSR